MSTDADSAAGDERQRVVEWCRERARTDLQQFKAREIADDLGISVHVIAKHLLRIEDRGLIGRWRSGNNITIWEVHPDRLLGGDSQ